MGLVVAGVGLLVAAGDALAAVEAGLGVGPVLVVEGPVAVVLAPVVAGRVVLVVEPGAGLAVLAAVEDAVGLVVGVALDVVAEEGLEDLDELMDALQGYEPLEGAALGAVLGAEIGL